MNTLSPDGVLPKLRFVRTTCLPLLAAFLLLAFGGCKQKSRFTVDSSHGPKVEIGRLDRDMLLLDTGNMLEGLRQLYENYPVFFPYYVVNVLGFNPSDTLSVVAALESFLTDSIFAEVNRDVLESYASIDDLEEALSTAYTHVRHYFPDIALPEVCLFVSGFNYSILMTDGVVGMGSDMYLGSDYPAYATLTYHYMANNMKRENLVPDLVSAWLFSTFRMEGGKNRLIDQMLYRGKVMFLLSVCLPHTPDEALIGYTPEQLAWCRRYERAMWATVIDQKHLFSSDVFLIRKYLNDAPFTSPISQDSPGRAGTWIGWQIVRSYMERNPEVSLQQLMQESDYELLLQKSGYRP